jgi:cyclopropane fatty-acyl-phospholipid synthase-like methyltransferase
VISCSSVQISQIRSHYNLATLFYRLLWGRHIHHGLWAGKETPSAAQQRLTETLATEAAIRTGDRVLDVGCGMGSSSIHLAKRLDCEVTGVTISSVQWQWARCAAFVHRARSRTRFLCADAEQVAFPPELFDVVWSIECTEHLYDKGRFFHQAARWLRPSGRVAICAWLAVDTTNPVHREQVHDVCKGFLCPSLGTEHDYRQWMSEAGLTDVRVMDWTGSVARTWEICRDRVRRTRVRWLAKILDINLVRFLDRFDTILEAYRTGAMRYGAFIAHKAT